MRIYTREHGEAMDLDEPVATLAAEAVLHGSGSGRSDPDPNQG